MGIPARPVALHEGPAESCIINGKPLGWTNCTPTSFAMGVQKATLGAKRPTGCSVRRVTGDTQGGTTIPQCAHAIDVEYGIKTDVHVGNAAAAPSAAAAALHRGRSVALQGNASALVNTEFRSTRGAVNHCVYVNEGRGWHTVGGLLVPSEALVFDPAADGRRAGWGTSDDSPGWWSWGLVKRFAAALRPWGDDDHRLLGPGRMYSAFFPDTEPHVHLRHGGTRTTPFPDSTVVHVAAGHRANVRSRPDRIRDEDIVARLKNGAPFEAYQRTHGVKPPGSSSDVWFGDHNGTRWTHISNLARIGGAS